MADKLSLCGIVVLLIYSIDAYSIELLCSKPEHLSSNANSNEVRFNVSGGLAKSNMTIQDVMDIFSFGSKNIDGEQVLICIFPDTHSATKKLYENLGIKTSVIQSFTNKNSIIDRHIKVVQSDSAMISCVTSSYPSIGYIEKMPNQYQYLSCY
ncbi:MAG: hypothetical protein ACKN9F_06955 [Methylomonas sp.]